MHELMFSQGSSKFSGRVLPVLTWLHIDYIMAWLVLYDTKWIGNYGWFPMISFSAEPLVRFVLLMKDGWWTSQHVSAHKLSNQQDLTAGAWLNFHFIVEKIKCCTYFIRCRKGPADTFDLSSQEYVRMYLSPLWNCSLWSPCLFIRLPVYRENCLSLVLDYYVIYKYFITCFFKERYRQLLGLQ